MRHRRTASLAALAAILAASFLLAPPKPTAYAQQVAGSAPFLNSWLVSGPFEAPVADKVYECEVPEQVNYAPQASTITASSSTLAVNPVSYLADGSTRSQWVTENDSSPWVQFSWRSPISLNEVRIAQWGDGRHVNNWYHLTFVLADGSTVASGQVNSTSASPSSPTLYSADPGLTNVVAMKIEIDKGRTPYPSITGISEVEVYNRPVPADGKNPITPGLGASFGFGGEHHDWEYFDDRLYNRNYDDYQDLYGYYTVKKGVDTRNKYVYASTYVYSPEAKDAYFDVGASGSYRIYVNDRCLTPPSTPVEVQKDLTKQAVQLRQGWNKLMIQIKHTYTEDVNANGVPIAKDQNVAYLGFYGRVADQNGNTVSGLTSSVAGPVPSLRIVSGGLATDDPVKVPFPRGNTPTGYQEWPYVWNKSTSTANHGVAASAFQFMAGGGQPGYTWKIVDGRLPDGLELNPDGTIADGLVNGNADLNSTKGIVSGTAATGDYSFTVQVTDRAGSTATKTFTTTVKERPNKWFEEGRVSALTHATPTYDYFVDPNHSADLWAARAKRQGHSLVSIEALQQNYFWPSKFADPKHIRQLYLPKDKTGQVVDGLKQYEQAVKRYGMKFGLYYATEGGGLQHYSTDVFVQNVEDLIGRYDPAYLYFDGPQAMPNANYDVMYSAVRDHSNDIVIDSNAWGQEYGDPDLRTGEASGIYSNAVQNHLVKRTPMEPWKMIRTKNQVSPYYGQRDDFRQVTKEMIMNASRGYVDNNDQTVIDSRGPNWDSPTTIATRYPKGVQEFIDVREQLADWFAPAGLPERHEATTGTTPYFLAGYGYQDDGRGNYEKFAFPNSTTGPQWGYATARDNDIYLHVVKGPDGKKGFDAIPGRTLTISPVKDRVTSVSWLNQNLPVTSFSQTGDSLTINLGNVGEDPIDTIIKIVTDNPARKYTLTNVVATGKQLAPGVLKVEAEGYMTFPALKANLSPVRYASADPSVAKVEPSGIVTPVSDGTTTITVTGTHEGVTKSDALKVSVKDGVVFVGEDMLGASLMIGGKETYGEFGLNDGLRYTIEGRSAKGGAIGLAAAKVTWHGGIVDLAGGDNYTPVAIKEVDTFKFEKNKIVTPQVDRLTRGVVWADVRLNGKTVTTNRVFLDLQPYRDLATTARITAGSDQDDVGALTDGRSIDAMHFDNLKWSSAAGTPSWIQFELPATSELSNLQLTYNTLDQRYLNTPTTIKIQTSVDAATWTDVSTVAGPTGKAYFGAYNQYPLNVQGKYVRLTFDGAANGAAIDLLEAAVNGK
ncbi:discoidin domain-containing protein [Kribbella sp. NPDC051936]|uniref:discoidin domain-containing protein n=1 Tax=Kribbella sp. NPDC051936 TaxID=3154946 RepID=UPI0034299EE0